MQTESTVDMIKLGVEYIMIVVFIGLAIKVLSLRNSYADAMNEQEISTYTVREALEFSMYDTGTNQNAKDEWVTGDEVIACFREYRDGEVAVYLDKTITDTPLLLNTSTFNGKSVLNGEEVNTFSLSNLMSIVNLSCYYHPYLVYDNEDITKPGSYAHTGDSVSGIAFIRCN